MSVGGKIRYYRKEKKMTQAQLAEAIGKSKSTIEKYEADKVNPTAKAIKDLVNILGIEFGDLYDSIEDMESGIDKRKTELEGFASELFATDVDIEEWDEGTRSSLENLLDIARARTSKFAKLVRNKELHNHISNPQELEEKYHIYIDTLEESNEQKLAEKDNEIQLLKMELQFKNEVIDECAKFIEKLKK